VHDPVYLTAPVSTGKKFIYIPGTRVEKYDCRR
jgi:hypothetical protein